MIMTRVACCPSCQRISSSTDSPCRDCGGPLAELTVVERAFWWCALEGRWRREPCGADPAERCCARLAVEAATVEDGESMQWGSFCPECGIASAHRAFRTACFGCGKAPVAASVVVRSWHWCAKERAWHRHPCSRTPGSVLGDRRCRMEMESAATAAITADLCALSRRIGDRQ